MKEVFRYFLPVGSKQPVQLFGGTSSIVQLLAAEAKRAIPLFGVACTISLNYNKIQLHTLTTVIEKSSLRKCQSGRKCRRLKAFL